MKAITPAELHRLLDIQPDLALLDVRTPVEFAEVHVSQARNIPLDEISPAELASEGWICREQPVYFLCRSGQRAAKAAKKFMEEDFSQTIVVEGGTLGWMEAGLPVVCGKTKTISLERQVRIVAGSLVFIGVALGWFVNPGFYGLSAFVGAGLVFAGITDFCGMGLLLAKLPWNTRVPR